MELIMHKTVLMRARKGIHFFSYSYNPTAH